jgi:hypothetical protein
LLRFINDKKMIFCLRPSLKTIFIIPYPSFEMKKIFAVFCAVWLVPSFSAHAWIGGPFSNNSFSDKVDDGVYEAVAIPVNNRANPNQVVKNGIGMYRWAVTNNTSFSDAVAPNAGIPFTSNVYFGGLGQVSHTWFIEGVAYRGLCEGTANSGIGVINCVGTAASSGGTALIESSFKGEFSNAGDGGEGVPISRFRAKGRGTLVGISNTARFRFRVFGSKVTQEVTYNGISG